jgi:hypothetical protein
MIWFLKEQIKGEGTLKGKGKLENSLKARFELVRT